jgi:hypothetical protein
MCAKVIVSNLEKQDTPASPTRDWLGGGYKGDGLLFDVSQLS